MSVESVTPSTSSRRARGTIEDRVDVAVVGAGLGGLMAAARLAQSGKRVAVFEGHYVAGGCATQFSRGPRSARYHFDVGLHYVGDCGADGQIPRLLREVGVHVDFRPMDQDGFDTLVFPGLEFRIPASTVAYRARLHDTFPSEKRAIDRYVDLVEAVMVAGRAMDKGGRPALRDWPALAVAGLRLGPHRHATIAQVFDAIGVRDPALRAVMLGQSGDYGLPPSKVSAMLHLGLAGHYFRGAYYPEGGGQVIADRLAARIEALGGAVHLRRPVEKILVEHGRAVGVRLPGKAGSPAREVRADVVISNADLKRTMTELVGPEHLPAELVQKTRGYQMAAALQITFLGVEGPIAGMRAANYWQFDSFDMEGFYGDDPNGPIRTHGCYVTSASLKDPRNASHHAPAGVTNVEVMTVVPGTVERFGVKWHEAESWDYRKNATYRAIKEALEEDMVGRLDALFPGTKARVVFCESATPVSHVRYTGATDGTGYGIACTPDQFFDKRPSYRTPLQGLYLAGASTRAGHGIVGAMSSGKNAALRVEKDLGAAARARA